MNEMRISKLESPIQTEYLQTTDHKNDMKTLESKYKKTIRFFIAIVVLISYSQISRRVFSFAEVDKRFLS